MLSHMDYDKDNKWLTCSQVSQRLIKKSLLDEAPCSTVCLIRTRIGQKNEEKAKTLKIPHNRWFKTGLSDETPCMLNPVNLLYLFLAIPS